MLKTLIRFVVVFLIASPTFAVTTTLQDTLNSFEIESDGGQYSYSSYSEAYTITVEEFENRLGRRLTILEKASLGDLYALPGQTFPVINVVLFETCWEVSLEVEALGENMERYPGTEFVYKFVEQNSCDD